jgi:hypothetical protein
LDRTCFICGRINASVDRVRHINSYDVECPRCGNYLIADSVVRMLDPEQTKTRFRAVLSEWVDNQNSNGEKPTITSDRLDELRSLPVLPFIERAKRLLILMADRTYRLGQSIDLSDVKIETRLQAIDPGETAFLADFLRGEGWVQGKLVLTAKGAIQADQWKRAASSSMQGFVAMWFNDSMNDAWTNGLQKAIVDAGYRPMRIDSKEHVNKICDEIVAEIRQSKFLVADFTGHRGGVYFEAGFAMGLALPVIWTCRKDALGDLHFDTRQYNFIDWETPGELANRLQKRIEAVIGRGPLKPR